MSLIRIAVLVVAAGVCGVTIAGCSCCCSGGTSTTGTAYLLPTQFAQELRPTQVNQPELAPVAEQR